MVAFILVAVFLLVLFAFAALALDFGHHHVVNNEIQTAADAVALAGASALYDISNPSIDPNFSRAVTAATNSITLNKSDKVTLTDTQVQTGYWDLSQNTPGLQASLPSGVTLGGNWVPAVMATVSRADGQNNGPMITFLASIFGINSISASKVAVAVVAFPGGVNPGVMLPVAINKTFLEETLYGPNPEASFSVGSAYHYGDSQAGQWTTFLADENNVPYVRGLITNGNPDTVNINTSGTCIPSNQDCIYIQPGTENTLYDTRNQADVNDLSGKIVCVPVVDAVLIDGVKEYVPVVGFVPMYIEYATGQNDKYIRAHFVPSAPACTGSGGGEYFGAVLPPKITR